MPARRQGHGDERQGARRALRRRPRGAQPAAAAQPHPGPLGAARQAGATRRAAGELRVQPAARALRRREGPGDAPQGAVPRWQRETFRRWFSRRAQPDGARATHGTVAYFHGCAGNYYEPWVPKAAVAVLERNGYAVTLPEQNCCGLPMQSNGEFHAARGYAGRNLRWLAPYARAGVPIVGHGSSCTLTLKSDYREILDIHTEEAALVAAHTYDVSEFLLQLYEAGELDTDFQPVEATVLYHAQCQLKAHKMGLPALELMDLIPGLKVHLSEAECCGVAGTYGYKVEKYDIGQAVGKPLWAQIERLKPDVIVCDSETCRWWIEATTGVPSIHPVEVYAAAYG
ncbi:MAG: anaerobic glycerol-3-phosphate dehydrogenase subunit C [Anaerolineae bacterium]|nr:anaerobic glycerol-3-phosphate dehydrogenase subunit C [Anaerolineae bacterium]